jgi:hypothetical protein
MYHVTNRSPLFVGVAAAAISATGMLAVPAPGHAAPGDCKYEFPGSFVLNQSNGFRVEFPATGTFASGTATSFNNSQAVADTGQVSGAINGTDVGLTIDWGGNVVGMYNGTVREGGTVAGQTSQAGTNNSATWESVTALKCIVEAAPPQQPPPGQQQKPPDPETPPPLTATVNGDVDLYDVPGGDGNVIGILRDGEVVSLPRPCPPAEWCEVTGKGWVWGDFLQPEA